MLMGMGAVREDSCPSISKQFNISLNKAELLGIEVK